MNMFKTIIASYDLTRESVRSPFIKFTELMEENELMELHHEITVEDMEMDNLLSLNRMSLGFNILKESITEESLEVPSLITNTNTKFAKTFSNKFFDMSSKIKLLAQDNELTNAILISRLESIESIDNVKVYEPNYDVILKSLKRNQIHKFKPLPLLHFTKEISSLDVNALSKYGKGKESYSNAFYVGRGVVRLFSLNGKVVTTMETIKLPILKMSNFGNGVTLHKMGVDIKAIIKALKKPANDVITELDEVRDEVSKVDKLFKDGKISSKELNNTLTFLYSKAKNIRLEMEDAVKAARLIIKYNLRGEQ